MLMPDAEEHGVSHSAFHIYGLVSNLVQQGVKYADEFKVEGEEHGKDRCKECPPQK